MDLTDEKAAKEGQVKYLNALTNALHKIGQRRRDELSATLPKHKDEIQKLPQILKVRMKALKDVNPQEFSDNPYVELSTLVTNELIKKFPDGNDSLLIKDVKQAHEKYGIEWGEDVPTRLATEIYFAYFDDIKNGAIDRSGKILDIEKSKVMRVPHVDEKYGLPIDAKETVDKFKQTTTSVNLTREYE